MRALHNPMENSHEGNAGPTVLVVDDEQELADLYADYIEDRYTVLTAYSGPAALEKLSTDVDVVLLDRRMPELSGDEVLERIRASDADCRVVFVTAVDPGPDTIDLPFDDYLVKPVDRSTVVDAIERMLHRNTYDERLMEVVNLASRMATLESKMDIEELEDSDEYVALRKRLADLRSETGLDGLEDDIYSELTAEKMRVLLD